MKSIPFLLSIAWLSLTTSGGGQQQAPAISYEPQADALRLQWESSRNRTFFPQASTGLDLWHYIGTLHFGPGTHVGMVQTDAPKAFFRLQYSDLPVDNETEAGTADFDLDGLPNLAELQTVHTDPLDKDTDKDGLPDGWEVARSISPLDNGSVNPANGASGTFVSPTPSGGGDDPAISNWDAFNTGVQAHVSASVSDRDGDRIPDHLDAGPLSRAINWPGDRSEPRLVYIPLPDYSPSVHDPVIACNENGDVLSAKSLYLNGSWNPLRAMATGDLAILPISMVVAGRAHAAYAKFQPIPTSVSNDGRIVGSVVVQPIPIDVEVEPGEVETYSPASTRLAVIWDSWNSPPRLLKHSGVVSGNSWDETARIAGDGTIFIRRRANTEILSDTRYRLVRYGPLDQFGSSGAFSSLNPAAIGSDGFQAFNAGTLSSYAWFPGVNSPRSLLADSTFTTPNPRSTFFPQVEPRFIGMKPGAEDGYCIKFWDKTMIRHEDRWQEAIELAGASYISRKGLALKQGQGGLQVWKGGDWSNFNVSVVNEDFSSSLVSIVGSTADGRVLLTHSDSQTTGAGFIMSPELVSKDKFLAGSIQIPPGWEHLKMEFVGPDGEDLGKYGDLLDGAETKIYNHVTDILGPGDGGQSSGQKVWFVRDPANSRKISYYTCFNSVGEVQIKLYLGNSGVPVAVIPHTLVPAQDFAATIAYVDAWVKGTSFNWGGGGGPPLSFNSTSGGIDNLTRACLIPYFNVIDQVEGLGAVMFGMLDGVKAGAEDDWEFLQLIGQGAVLAGNWASQQASAELQRWKDDPLKRAAELKQLTDRLCEDVVFGALERISQTPVTWESVKERAWSAAAASLRLSVRVFAFNHAAWRYIVDELTEWADDFVARMAQGAEKARWDSAPWAKSRLVEDVNSTDRLICYTFGYTLGYLCEQVAVGALTSGVGKIAQVATKGGISLAANLAKRTAATVAVRAHWVKKILADSGLADAAIRAAFERGFVLCAVEPVGPTIKQAAFDILESLFTRQGFNRATYNFQSYLNDLASRPNLRQLTLSPGGEALVSRRAAQLATLLGDECDEVIMKNFMKFADEQICLAKPDGTVEECFEAFFRAFQGNPSLMTTVDDPFFSISSLSPEGKAILKKFLSDPNAGKLWEIDVPAIVDDEPAVPHNYWVRGILGELIIYRKQYRGLGYLHSPTAQGYDFTGPKWVQIKTLKNPDGAIGAMKKAVNDLIEFSPGPPNPRPLRLHILKKPGTSSSQLESAIQSHIDDGTAADRFELIIQEFEL